MRPPTDYEFIVDMGPDCGRSFPLPPGRHTLGRSAACGIVIEDPTLELHHVMVVWRPPVLALDMLAGYGEVEGRTVRVGRSVCSVRRVEDAAQTLGGVFHRPPRGREDPVQRPTRAPMSPEPVRRTSPAWSSVITGLITGVAVASLSGHWTFAIMSAITAVVTGAMWIGGVLTHRRRHRRWRRRREVSDVQFAAACHDYAQELAHRRRYAHPTMSWMRDEISRGGGWLWHQRSLDVVAIGHGSRALTIVDDAPAVALDDIPVLIDVSPRTIVGIHGQSAQRTAAALLVRMAARVGPSDWRLMLAGSLDPSWDMVACLPHWGGSLTRDGQVSAGELDSIALYRHVVIFVADPRILTRHSALMLAFERGAVTLVVIAADRASLPSSCTDIVDADDDETDGIGFDTCAALCAAISRWVDPDCDGVGLPSQVSFVELHGAGEITADEILRTWQHRRGGGPRAFLGLGHDGVIDLELDRDGPHGVIIGTTGSGKSELLRQIVLSMSLHGSPADVTFVLIDYKGGAAFDACCRLPHVVGVVTDLDGGMVERVLIGLDVELRRREGILRAAGVSDICSFHARSQRDSERPSSLPRLVVVIDELAALRDEVPTFVTALAAIAQRGRSLGLHLLTASQRSAASTADVLANASIRIALRVQSSTESRDIIGSDRAAMISRSRPGRLVMRLGADDEILVQSARVSSTLDRVVDTVCQAHRRTNNVIGHRPWTDPLPEVLFRPDDCESGVVGVIDDLHRQQRRSWSYDVEQHLVIMGGVGRTNAVRAIVQSLYHRCEEFDVLTIACRPSPAPELAGFGLHVDLDDVEHLARIVRVCAARLEASTSSHHRRILLIVEDFDLWRSRIMGDRIHAELWDEVERIITARATTNVVCILTTSRDQGVPTSVQTRVSQVWKGTDRPGVFTVDDRHGTPGGAMQVFWVPEVSPPSTSHTWSVSTEILTATRCLPPVLRRGVDEVGFAVHADTWTDVALETGSPVRLLVIGPRASGVTNALRSLVSAWTTTHPQGVVHQSAASTLEAWTQATIISGPTLIVIDDLGRGPGSASTRVPTWTHVLDDASRSDHVSVIVGVSASLLRSRSDHWVQTIRRARTGVLLGRSVDEDWDLLGLHAPPLHVYRPSVGRGVWVDNGIGRGVVQFYDEPTP